MRQVTRIVDSTSFFGDKQSESVHPPPFFEQRKKNHRIFPLFSSRQRRIVASISFSCADKPESLHPLSCFNQPKKNPRIYLLVLRQQRKIHARSFPVLRQQGKIHAQSFPVLRQQGKIRPKLVSVKRSERGERSEDLRLSEASFRSSASRGSGVAKQVQP